MKPHDLKWAFPTLCDGCHRRDDICTIEGVDKMVIFATIVYFENSVFSGENVLHLKMEIRLKNWIRMTFQYR